MYFDSRVGVVIRCLRAVASNQVARLAPRFYLNVTSQTGRGSHVETVKEVADYFFECFDDYFRKLGVPREDITAYLSGKSVLEYGPGDLPGVGMLMYAHGAEKVICVDRFSMVSINQKNTQILENIISRLDGEALERVMSCFNDFGEISSGFAENRICYYIHPNGLSGLKNSVDLVYSRAVLEHVNDLYATFLDMASALKTGGTAIHKVDLKSHGLHEKNPLDFLVWPTRLWNLMYAHKGAPNRWRLNKYLEVIEMIPVDTILIEATELAAESDVDNIGPYLAKPFQEVSKEDLAWLGFWLVLRKSDGSAMRNVQDVSSNIKEPLINSGRADVIFDSRMPAMN
ncbi:MAG TPA: methyltransferase domain-containing protein [Chromatiales bacterium]|nr:methyltransferase domain-containing protein [Chromatiales bacterium]